VASTALHASLLHDAEALRVTVPGLERFKMAAVQNVSRWNPGQLTLGGDVQSYDPASKSFVDTSIRSIKGPFVYLVTALVDRFESTFVVAPFQAPPGSNRPLAPEQPVIDVILIRPLRHSTTARLYDAATDDSERERIRQSYAQQLWQVTGGMYGGGTHVSMTYEDEPEVNIVEYYRCERVTWEPVSPID
jgi:hypothetical protein